MIVYSDSKRGFIDDVINNKIADKIRDKFIKSGTYLNFDSQFSA